jgi:hypothetical protein
MYPDSYFLKSYMITYMLFKSLRFNKKNSMFVTFGRYKYSLFSERIHELNLSEDI